MADRRKTNPRAEYVYSEHFSAIGHRTYSTLHRIIKKTPSIIYVDNVHENPYGWRGFGIRVLFALDREELENTGRTWSHIQRCYFYTPAPDLIDFFDDEEDEEIPDFIDTLGLKVPFTIDDVKKAYRQKAKLTHPDRGGSIEAFINLQETYEKALAFFEIPQTNIE